MLFSREQLTAIAAVVITAILLPVIAFLLRWLWERWWRGKDGNATKAASVIDDHANRLGAVEKRLSEVEIRDEERRGLAQLREEDRQKAIGKLETEHNILAGKVVGLQDFWRNEFGNLRRELRDDHQKLREELRQDQANTESRLTVLMTGHQQRVHDRLNVIAADQAKLLTEFVDQLADRKAEGK